jgi:hypothetical protein
VQKGHQALPPGNSPVGIIAISKTGCAIVSNRQMAHHALIEEH